MRRHRTASPRPRNRGACIVAVVLAASLAAHALGFEDPACTDALEGVEYYLSIGDKPSAMKLVRELKEPGSPCPWIDNARTLASYEQQSTVSETAPAYSTLFVSPFVAYLKYGPAAVKDTGMGIGAYASWTDYTTLFELTGDRLAFRLRNGASDVVQYEGAASLSRWLGRHASARIGAAHITSSDSFAARVTAATVGGAYLEPEFALGALLHYTYYPKLSNETFTIAQMTPYYSYFDGNMTATARLYFIVPLASSDAAVPFVLGGKTMFVSGELELRYKLGDLVVGASAYAGDQMFAVKQNGTMIFNTIEDFKAGAALTASVSLTPSLLFRVDGGYQWINVIATGAGYSVASGAAFLGLTL